MHGTNDVQLAHAVDEEGRMGHGSDRREAMFWCHIAELAQLCGACTDSRFAIRKKGSVLDKVWWTLEVWSSSGVMRTAS